MGCIYDLHILLRCLDCASSTKGILDRISLFTSSSTSYITTPGCLVGWYCFHGYAYRGHVIEHFLVYEDDCNYAGTSPLAQRREEDALTQQARKLVESTVDNGILFHDTLRGCGNGLRKTRGRGYQPKYSTHVKAWFITRLYLARVLISLGR
jgi:hypothetical protein